MFSRGQEWFHGKCLGRTSGVKDRKTLVKVKAEDWEIALLCLADSVPLRASFSLGSPQCVTYYLIRTRFCSTNGIYIYSFNCLSTPLKVVVKLNLYSYVWKTSAVLVFVLVAET